MDPITAIATGAGAAQAGMNALKTLQQIIKELGGARTADEAKAKVAELTNALLDAQQERADAIEERLRLVQKVHELNAQLEDARGAKRDKLLEKYELTEPELGIVALRSKIEEGSTDPIHYICQACAEKGERMILIASLYRHTCPGCKTDVPFCQRKVETVATGNPRVSGPHRWME